MESVRKKTKKAFSVPAAKPECSLHEPVKKDVNTTDADVCQNDKKVSKTDSAAENLASKKRRLKSEDMTKKNGKSDSLENTEKKPKIKIDKEIKKDLDVVKKKEQRSLTDEAYDDIFMAVLQRVTKAEQEEESLQTNENLGDEPTFKEDRESEKTFVTSEDEDETQSQVIEVTVKVQNLEEQSNLDKMEDEDIDKWDGAGSLPEKDASSLTVSLLSPSRKKSVKELNMEIEQKPELPSSASGCVKSKKKKISFMNNQKKKVMKGTATKSSFTKKRDSEPQPDKHTEKKSLKQVMIERELEDLGTWVQCGNRSCLKWRYLKNVTDPMDIPHRWECSMNTSEAYNSCNKPEEEYDESEHIYTKYTEGSVVLAKLAGYPWWPGMIEIDPDFDTYFEVAVPASMYPTKYHVVFFDKNVSRAWVSLSSIKPFEEIEALPRKCKGHDYTREVNAAVKNAVDALGLPIKERLKKFSFATRFSGKWGHFGERSKGSKSRGPNKYPRKRKLNKGEEDLVDDATLDQILNNSQSVLSDVVEMLSSIGNEAVDSDNDTEFDLKGTIRESKNPTVHQENCAENKEDPLWNTATASDDEEPLRNGIRFEVTELDKDIFTMELNSTQMVDLNVEKSLGIQVHDKHLDAEEFDLEDAGLAKGEMSGGNADKSDLSTASAAGRSNPDKKKKKKLKEICDDSVDTEEKAKKKSISSEDNDGKSSKNSTSKKSKKKKKDFEGVIMSEKAVKKSDIKENKMKKDQTDSTSAEIQDRKENDLKDPKSKLDEGEKEKKTKKKKNKREKGSVSESEEEEKKVKSANSEQFEKEIPNEEKVSTESKTLAAFTSKDTDSMSQSKKQRKTKARFTNPLQNTEIRNSSQKETKDDDSAKQTLKKNCKLPNVDQLKSDEKSSPKRKKHMTKNKHENDKRDTKDDKNESGDELDLSFDNVGKSLVDGADSDGDFMMDLNGTINEKNRRAEAVTANVDEDSEPLDFEE